jgi:murein DD-endopeptidase MepM/ murein hydrolase activator NlpD
MVQHTSAQEPSKKVTNWQYPLNASSSADDLNPHPVLGKSCPTNAELLTNFDNPEKNWNAGHRGIDIAAYPDLTVFSPTDGYVTYAGNIAGVGNLSIKINSSNSSRVTLQPINTSLKAGDVVLKGDAIGTVSSYDNESSHTENCNSENSCLHVGVIKTSDLGEDSYTNPLLYFCGVPSFGLIQ